MLLEDFQGRLVAEAAVEPLPIVEHLNVFGNSAASAFSGGEDVPVDEFVLQRTEERFSHRIVPAHTGPTHARLHVVFFQEGGELGAGVLRSAVGVKDRARGELAPPLQ